MDVSVNGMRGNMHDEMMELKKAIQSFQEWHEGESFLSPQEAIDDAKEKFDSIACTINAFQCCFIDEFEDDFDDQGDNYCIPIFCEEDEK